MNITLNDFRNILGAVNDGNVVFTRINDELTGIEKANYGLLFTRNVKASSEEENAELRKQFARAIANACSQDRPTISNETLDAIKLKLGIADAGGHPAWDVITKPLSRREIKAILDIVDDSCEHIKADNEALAKMSGGFDMGKRREFERAVNASPLLSGKNSLKTVIGPTFLGFPRAEVAASVGKHLALLKAMTLDEMTWSYQSTGNELSVEEAFKESLGKMMREFGQGRMPVTRTRDLFATSREIFAAEPGLVAFDDIEHNADDFFRTNRLMPESALAALLTDDPQHTTDAFSKFVLSRASDHVKNAFRRDFQECITAKGNNAQQAQGAYDARTLGVRGTLEDLANDVRGLVSADAGCLAKFRSDLAKNLVEAMRGTDPAALGDVAFRDLFMAVLAKTVAPFSMRQMAAEFVRSSTHPDLQNADFAYAYIDDFSKRVASLPQNSGYRANVAHWQLQSFLAVRGGSRIPELGPSLRNGALESLYNEFKTAREQADPEVLRERRLARNREAAIRTIRAQVGDDAAFNNFSHAMLEDRIGSAYVDFYQCAHGYYSLKDADLNNIPRDVARARALEWVMTVSDDEIAFLEKFCSLGMLSKDSMLQSTYFTETGKKPENPPLYSALRDAGNVINDMSKESLVAIFTFLLIDLNRLSRNGGNVSGGKFACIQEVGNTGRDKPQTKVNCKAFVDKLQLEAAKAGETRPILTDEQKASIQTSFQPEMKTHTLLAGTGYLNVTGFGTFDALKIIKLLARAGISMKDFSVANQDRRAEASVRTLALMHFAACNNYNLDSLPEYIQRVTGKGVKEVSFSDYIVFSKLEAEKRDPVPPGFEDVVNIVTGKVKLAEAKLSNEEVCDLRKAMSAIRRPGAKPESVKLKGKTITLEMLVDGGVRASLRTGDKVPVVKQYRLSQSAVDFSRAVDDMIIANAKDYAQDVVKSVLPPLPNPAQGDSLMRAREVYAKTICAFAENRSPVDYASVPTARLRQLAVAAVERKELPALNEIPQTFNSAEMIEMHKNLGAVTLAEVDAKVKFSADAPKRTDESRRTVPPTAKEFRAIVADLFLNEDTWAFDAQVGAVPGDRIRKLMLANAPELHFVFLDIPGFVRHLDEAIRDKVAEILTKLKDIPAESLLPNAQGNVEPATMQALAEAEALVDALVKTYAEAMQEKVTELFTVENQDAGDKPLQYQTFAEISGISALNPNTAEGKFALGILNGYFKKSARVDQRAMLAAMLRNTDNTSSNAKQVAELLKGAGPLLQKMLQGLPISSFNAETQLALKDMKSRLAPIPADAVKAQLLELVNSSNGEILSIEVKKVLGAASVGEALLCHIKTKDRPVTGEDCVIKVLRPNIYTAVLREKAIFDEIIEHDVPEIKRQFEIRYKGILEEFDLTIEAENIRLGKVHYEHPKIDGTSMLNISSMDFVENVSPTTGTLVVKKADGVTYDRYIEDIHAEADEVIGRIKPNAIRVNGRVTRPCSSMKELLATRRRLEYLKGYLGERRNHISDFAHAWFENGLYGDGFMHGDLHAGNIMVSDKGATVIDFGNCIRLSSADQENIRNMVTKASIGYGEDAIKTFRNLLGQDAKAKLDAVLADPQKAAFRKNLYGVFKKGTAADVMARIYAAMNLLQREGVEIPGAVTNFFQSFSRLNDIYQTMTDEMARIDAMIDTLVLDEPALPQIGDGAPKFVKDLMSFFVSVSSNPDKEFDFEKFAATANKFINDDIYVLKDGNGQIYGGENNVGLYAKEGAQEISEVVMLLLTDREKFNATVMPLLEWAARQEIPFDGMLYLRDDLGKIFANSFGGNMKDLFDRAIAVVKDMNVPKDSKEYRDACDDLVKALPHLLNYAASTLAKFVDPTPRTRVKFSGLDGVKESYDRPIYAVCGQVVASKLENFRAFASQLGMFIRDFYSRRSAVSVEVRENMRYSGKLEYRRKFARETLERANDALDVNLRLTTARRRVLMRQMESFAWPFEGAWTETHGKGPNDAVNKIKFGLPQEKRAVFLEALAVNLGELKSALGFAENENLPPEVARLALTYLAQVDPRAALAVKSLDEASYNAFLADINQREDAALLGAAVAALRNAPDDAQLLASMPGAAATFAGIDRKADKIDLSLGGLFDMFKGLFSNDG